MFKTGFAMIKDAPVGTESLEIESSPTAPARSPEMMPGISRPLVGRAVWSTLMFLLFLVLSAGVFVRQAQAQGLTLGGTEEAAPASNDGAAKKPLDLGPAPKPAATAKPPAAKPAAGAGNLGAPPDLADLVRTKHGDWDVACEKAGKPCVMAQIGNDNKGVPILEMVLRTLPEVQEIQGQKVVAVADIITPLGVVLTSGLSVQIDSQQEQRAPFQICTEQGCLVREPLTEEAVQRFKKGANARLTVVAAQQGAVSAIISLRGFTKAFNSL